MPSRSILDWLRVRVPQLEEMEHAHSRVGGPERGRRYATRQINHAYAVLLSSQFQGFCRDLHSECIDYVSACVQPPKGTSGTDIQRIVKRELLARRFLDTGNPSPGNIGADFNRFGLDFWAAVKTADWRNARRQGALEELNHWRNAIAHQDFGPVNLGGGRAFEFDSYLSIVEVRKRRSACAGLAVTFDAVMERRITALTGSNPW
jgi:hypothetical protein